MARSDETGTLDAVLRGAGSALLLIGCLAIRYLAHDYPMRRPQEPSLLDIASASVGFLALSGSAILAIFGAHIFDEVEVSRRWTRRRSIIG